MPLMSQIENRDTDPLALETIQEAMARLSVGRTKLYALIKAGEIEIVKPGPRMTRVVTASRRAYVDRLRQTNT